MIVKTAAFFLFFYFSSNNTNHAYLFGNKPKIDLNLILETVKLNPS